MAINNLELIALLLPKDNPKVFCHMQIICRAKDHKDEKVKGCSLYLEMASTDAWTWTLLEQIKKQERDLLILTPSLNLFTMVLNIL